MSKFFVLCLFVAICLATVVISCGSNWTISGNNLIITPIEQDSLVPAGSYVITPLDSI